MFKDARNFISGSASDPSEKNLGAAESDQNTPVQAGSGFKNLLKQ